MKKESLKDVLFSFKSISCNFCGSPGKITPVSFSQLPQNIQDIIFKANLSFEVYRCHKCNKNGIHIFK